MVLRRSIYSGDLSTAGESEDFDLFHGYLFARVFVVGDQHCHFDCWMLAGSRQFEEYRIGIRDGG